MLKYGLIFIVVVLGVPNCTTKDGTNFVAGKGAIYVKTTVADSARIFLDYRDTGLLTPALLGNIPDGKHVVQVFRSYFRAAPDSFLIAVRENDTLEVTFQMEITATGSIAVNSLPDSARFLLNKMEFGTTPLQIEGLPVGTYGLTLIKGNFGIISDTIVMKAKDKLSLFYRLEEDIRKIVLLEHFSNTSCPPCPTSDAIIDDILAPDYGPGRLIIISYHTNFPGNDDPMYLAAEDENLRRIDFYKPIGIPRAFVDGRPVPDPLSEQSYRNLIGQQLMSDTLATIGFAQLIRGDTILSGRLEIGALDRIEPVNRLFIALIEDEIDYDTPPGNNGQHHFETVLRDFYPNGQGVPVTLNPGEKEFVDFSFDLKNEWGRDLTVVAFIQDTATKSVLQAGWTRYPPL
jgi:hypothetical protein